MDTKTKIDFEKMAQTLKLLGDQTRLTMMKLLANLSYDHLAA